jgi:hypothetical protein
MIWRPLRGLREGRGSGFGPTGWSDVAIGWRPDGLKQVIMPLRGEAAVMQLVEEEGKCKMVALVAAMRKMLRIINTVLKKNEHWQPNIIKMA